MPYTSVRWHVVTTSPVSAMTWVPQITVAGRERGSSGDSRLLPPVTWAGVSERPLAPDAERVRDVADLRSSALHAVDGPQRGDELRLGHTGAAGDVGCLGAPVQLRRRQIRQIIRLRARATAGFLG
jgi:hypothetical protein